MRPWTNKSVCLGIAGLILVAIGTSLCFFSPVLFRWILQKGLSLTPTSRSFEVWKDTSSLPPIHIRFYFFNWTNPEDINVPGTKPILQQLGPYSFVELRQKTNITFHPENYTVSYFQKKWWYFDPASSNGSLTDNITQLNAVAVAAAHKTRFWNYFMQNSLSIVLSTKGAKVYVSKTIDELLFKGYVDPVIDMGKMIATEEVPPFDRFGWFYMRNGSTFFDGHINMNTGEDDISKLGMIRKWNNKDITKFYRSPCNIVEGSAGEFWPPDRTRDEISLFSSDLCRPLVYEYVGNVSLLGIEGYRYEIGGKTLGNDTRRRYPHDQAKYFEPTTTTEDFFTAEHSMEQTEPPEDDPDVINMGQCYCNGECSPTGLLNITLCRYGAPAFVSLPHFLKADPMLRDQVVGLDPNEDEHNFYITLEPKTGIPLEVAARFQINILMQPSKTVSLFNKVPKIYFPIFWFSMNVKPTEELASDLKHLLRLPSVFVYAGVLTVIIGSFIIFTIALLHVIKKQRTNSTDMSGRSEPSTDKKSELLYLDKVAANEGTHVRSDRRLYPKLY